MNNILITGGTRGIGRCTADLFEKDGWRVFPIGRKECDLSRFGKVIKYLNAFPEDVPIDALVFSHGEWVSGGYTIDTFYDQYFSRVIAPLEFINHFATQLQMSPVGAVVFVSSTRGFIGGVDTAPYSLACAAQIALVQGYAREYKDVRFSCVCPGLTNTRMGKEVIRTGGAKPTAVPQPPRSVALEIQKLVLDKTANGKIVRVADRIVSEARWEY